MDTIQIVTICTSILSALGVGTIIPMLVKEHLARKKEQSTERQKELKQERLEEIKTSISAEVSPMKTQLDKIVSGTKATLRNDLMECYYMCKEKGYRTEDDTQNFTSMHKAYHDLGGNSFIDKDIAPMFFEHVPLKNLEKDSQRIILIEHEG